MCNCCFHPTQPLATLVTTMSVVWSFISTFIPYTYTHPLGITLPRTAWGWLNCLRTSVRRFHSCLYRWGVAISVACDCGTEEQTVNHVVFQCLIRQPLHGLHGLMVLDDETKHLPQDLVQPSSGLKNWLKRRRIFLVFLFVS